MPSNVQGTFNYMSPEAFDPEQFGGVTFSADSWSFACSLLEMLTGVKPWNGMPVRIGLFCSRLGLF
jgi:serine/threonine protein kinase